MRPSPSPLPAVLLGKAAARLSSKAGGGGSSMGGSATGGGAWKSEEQKLHKGIADMDSMLKRLTVAAEKFPTPKATDLKLPTVDQVMGGTDPMQMKHGLMEFVTGMKQAESMAAMLTMQIGHLMNEPGEEQDAWFRKQQREYFAQQTVTDHKLEVVRTAAASPTMYKNCTWADLRHGYLLGTVMVNKGEDKRAKWVKHIAHASFPSSHGGSVGGSHGGSFSITESSIQTSAPASSTALVLQNPVGLYLCPSGGFSIVCNAQYQSGSSPIPTIAVAKVSTSTTTPEKYTYEWKRVDGLFEQGLQAVDLATSPSDGKRAYLLVRGVGAGSRRPAHGIAVLDTDQGFVQQWMSLTDRVSPYAELHSFTISPSGSMIIQGIVRHYASSSSCCAATPPYSAVSFQFDPVSMNMDAEQKQAAAVAEKIPDGSHKLPNGTVDDRFVKLRCIPELPSWLLGTWKGSGGAQRMPQAILKPDGSVVTLPDAYHIHKLVPWPLSTFGGSAGSCILALGSYVDSVSDYLVVKITY